MKLSSLRLAVLVIVPLAAACGAPRSEAPEASPHQREPARDVTPTLAQYPGIAVEGPVVGSSMVWLDDSVLVYVPAGAFAIGGRGSDNPEHTVELSPFWIARNKVKNSQFALCVAAGACTQPSDPAVAAAISTPIAAEYPVVALDWLQADAYCRWSGGHLPTEAQWEGAARGPRALTFPWGDEPPTCDLVNAAGCDGDVSKSSAHPSGQSYFGALDMAGNAFEWVQDWYGVNYYEASSASDPLGPSAPDPGTGRVVRGSSHSSGFDSLESARRAYQDPAVPRPDLGFRCVVETPRLPTPFCQTSPYESSGPGGPAKRCMLPSIEVGATYCNQGYPYANVTISGPATSVTSDKLRCSDQGGGLWTCTGPNKSTSEVVACSCPGLPPDPAAGPQVCPANQVLGLAANCTPLVDPSADAACPAGFSPRSALGGIVCIAEAVPPFMQAPTICPVGAYLDAQSRTCVGMGPVARTCLVGFSYDPAQGCCASPIPRTGLEMSTYPGCPPFKYFDPLTHECVGSRALGVQAEGCVSKTVYVGACGQSRCSGLSADRCRDMPGCVLRGGVCEIGD